MDKNTSNATTKPNIPNPARFRFVAIKQYLYMSDNIQATMATRWKKKKLIVRLCPGIDLKPCISLYFQITLC